MDCFVSFEKGLSIITITKKYPSFGFKIFLKLKTVLDYCVKTHFQFYWLSDKQLTNHCESNNTTCLCQTEDFLLSFQSYFAKQMILDLTQKPT